MATPNDINVNLTATENVSQAAAKAESAIKRVGNSADKVQTQFKKFPMELLSIGFGFASIAAVMNTFIRDAINTFDQMGNSLTSGRLAFLELEASLKLLFFQFANSSVMVDFLNKIKDLVDDFNNLDENTKNFVYKLIIMSFIVSTLLSSLGFMGLLLNGLEVAFAKATIAADGFNFAIQFLKALLIPEFAAAILLIILAILVLKGIWDSNFAGIRDTAKSVFDEIGATIDSLVKHGTLVLGGLGHVIGGLFSGNLSEVKLGLSQILFGFLGLVVDIIALALYLSVKLVEIILRGMLGLASTLDQLLIEIVGNGLKILYELAVDLINLIMGTISKLKGEQFIPFDKSDFSKTISDFQAGNKQLTDSWQNTLAQMGINSENFLKSDKARTLADLAALFGLDASGNPLGGSAANSSSPGAPLNSSVQTLVNNANAIQEQTTATTNLTQSIMDLNTTILANNSNALGHSNDYNVSIGGVTYNGNGQVTQDDLNKLADQLMQQFMDVLIQNGVVH